MITAATNLLALFRRSSNNDGEVKDTGFINRVKTQIQARSKRGCVTIIGAGPGDVELLTLKAYRALQNSDVILFDALVSDEVVALFPKQVQRIYVGKRYAQHSMSQEGISALMLKLALEGKQVVRVKGGDPAIFARVGEECQVLQQSGVPVCVVPGVTAASGASSYAGIPLTHRSCAQSVRFVTAHMKSAETEPNWASLSEGVSGQSKNGETLVFYMGLRRIDLIAQRLIEHGVSASLPVAVIENATTPMQKICIATLSDIAEKVRDQKISGPAITIVGEVVNLRYPVEREAAAVATA
ncbi:MAG: uroporphyrinogen-III C-methyltransferase [Oleiphilaceae bacterium]|nr:uroporphyrinogen-III C-methyltransferase [Oleiphilaceae bacterium]